MAGFRLGLTPVFLDNDAAVIAQLRGTLAAAMGRPIEPVQRGTCREVTGLLLEGAVDAAWLCGCPFLEHEAALALIGVPVWQERPLCRSCPIAAPGDPAEGIGDLEGATHAVPDPDRNPGWLVTASDLARMGRRVEDHFARTVFTCGHRNVVRTVATGLTRSGSVDGFVWEVLAEAEPALALRTRVVARSEWLGFPPFVARRDRATAPAVETFRRALLAMPGTEEGRKALDLLRLDGIEPGERALFDGIALRMQDLGGGR